VRETAPREVGLWGDGFGEGEDNWGEYGLVERGTDVARPMRKKA